MLRAKLRQRHNGCFFFITLVPETQSDVTKLKKLRLTLRAPKEKLFGAEASLYNTDLLNLNLKTSRESLTIMLA